MKNLKLNTSYKHHVLAGLIISLWLVAFLVLIAPFDAGELPLHIRAQILPFYGVISLVSYIMVIPAQNYFYKKLSYWNIVSELLFITVFNLFCFIGTYAYYKSSVINGEYGFAKFTLEVYLPIFFVLLIIIIFARWFFNYKVSDPNSDRIILTGENKLDILKMNPSDLISISSADNYIEVNYLKGGKLQKKLLRKTLKNISEEMPFLLKVHRSHLINPSHFKEWKDSSTLILTEIEVPISKSYKQALLGENHSPLKSNGSSQT